MSDPELEALWQRLNDRALAAESKPKRQHFAGYACLTHAQLCEIRDPSNSPTKLSLKYRCSVTTIERIRSGDSPIQARGRGVNLFFNDAQIREIRQAKTAADVRRLKTKFRCSADTIYKIRDRKSVV